MNQKQEKTANSLTNTLQTMISSLGTMTDFIHLFALLGVVYLTRSMPFMWVAMAFLAVLKIVKIYVRLRFRNESNTMRGAIHMFSRKKLPKNIKGDYYDSAIHVAGHPLLGRDQEVLLSLNRAWLSIYDRESSELITRLDVTELDKFQTVSYDDQRVPYVNVIDSAAQAILLTFGFEGETSTALFRNMLDVRPIDWYQAILKARVGKY